MSKELLMERVDSKFYHKKEGGKFVVEGILTQKNEKRNQNGRIYPEEVLVREVEKYKNSIIKENRALGELDHPDSSVINLKNVSHNILDCWWDNDNLIGKLEILSTPCGNIAKALFESGIPVGISSRALGSVKTIGENTVEVQDDLELLAWDLVSNPSCAPAFLHPINESFDKLKSEQINKNNRINDIIREILTSL